VLRVSELFALPADLGESCQLCGENDRGPEGSPRRNALEHLSDSLSGLFLRRERPAPHNGPLATQNGNPLRRR
jgi:hypothetical protein